MSAFALSESVAVADPPSLLRKAQRTRPVHLHPAVRAPGVVQIGDDLVLDLFADLRVTARVDRVDLNVNQSFSIRAWMEGRDGHVLISTTGDRTLATISDPESPNVRIIQQFPGQPHHLLMDTARENLDVFEDCQCPEAPIPFSALFAQGDEPASDPNAPAEIDVMIVYSPAARTWGNNSGGGIDNIIGQAMERANLTAANSDTFVTFRLVHSAEIPYVKSGNAVTDLERLTFTNDGFMDEVHAWRDTYGADLVALFEDEPNTGGIAWLLNNQNGNPAFGFSITRVQQASWTYTHAHEMAHNMGCGHHRDQNSQPGPGLFSYAAGWRWVGTDNSRYCSIMTYSQGSFFADGLTHTRVPHFSNPSVNHAGVPTGTSNDDNARTIRNTKHAVAAYRPTMVQDSYTLETFVYPSGAGSIAADPLPDADGSYAAGTVVSLSATPGAGRYLMAWHGDVPGCPSVSAVVVTMNQDRVVSARFGGDPDLFLQVSNPPSGSTFPTNVDEIDLSGIAGSSVVGQLAWSNAANAQVGVGTASPLWNLEAIPLAPGSNQIHITATNLSASTVRRGFDSATNALYQAGWSSGQNGGTGYQPWTLDVVGANGGHFIGAAGHPRQLLGSHAWGLWANSGSTSIAERPLEQPLWIGDSFAMRFQNNWIGSQRSVGVSFQNIHGEYLVEFLFIGGGSHYLVNDSISSRNTGISWTDQPLSLTFTRTGCTTYQLDIDSEITILGTQQQRENQDVAVIHVWNFSAGSGQNYDLFFDTLETFTGPSPDGMTSTVAEYFRESEPDEQTIDFPEMPDQLLTNTFTLAATASSGLPVAFAVDSGPAILNGETQLSFSATGVVSVTASQAGDANWAPAPDVTRIFWVTKFVDVNRNGIPDEWELFYFESLDVVTDTSDFDGDGQTDREEYIAGTDPTDPDDYFRFDEPDIIPGFPSQFVLRWASVSGRVYQVERVLDVVSDYEPVSGELPATPPINEFTEPAPDSDIFYYRVKVWEAP